MATRSTAKTIPTKATARFAKTAQPAADAPTRTAQLRDFGLLLGAVTPARMSVVYDRPLRGAR